MVDRSEDLYEHLQELLDHCALEGGATAGYLGKVVKPIKGIRQGLAEDADELEHIMDDAPEQIQWQYTTTDFEFLYEKTLAQDKGVTYRLFQEEEVNAKNRIIIDENESTGLPKHIFVKDVVREKDMFYYKVPRLGSYLAIRLEYDSCLTEEAYDAAVENYIEVDQLNTNQEEEKRAWEDEQAELARAKAEAAAENEEAD